MSDRQIFNNYKLLILKVGIYNMMQTLWGGVTFDAGKRTKIENNPFYCYVNNQTKDEQETP